MRNANQATGQSTKHKAHSTKRKAHGTNEKIILSWSRYYICGMARGSDMLFCEAVFFCAKNTPRKRLKPQSHIANNIASLLPSQFIAKNVD